MVGEDDHLTQMGSQRDSCSVVVVAAADKAVQVPSSFLRSDAAETHMLDDFDSPYVQIEELGLH